MAEGVPALQQLQQMRGSDVVDASGEKIGSLEDVYVDRDTGQPEWVGVKKGMMGRSHVLVPLSGAQSAENSLTVAVARERVESAPEMDAEEINDSTEADLYRHYGIQRAGAAPGAAGTAEGQAATTDRDLDRSDIDRGDLDGDDRDEDSMTLHEERVDIGKREVPAGTARLRKYVETDRVEEDVPLRSEQAEVRRESIDQPAPGARMGEGTAEVDLEREEAVVDKETYATEQVSLEKETDVTQERVSEEVSRERAELEGEEGRREPGTRGKDQPNL